MASPAATKYREAAERARVLLTTKNDPRLRPMTHAQAQAYLHSSLAASVAAWNAYVYNLVLDFFRETSNPLVVSFSEMHTVAQNSAERSLERFNTPNWENSRNLLLLCTGYDPIAYWIWPAASLISILSFGPL
jgi:hypothetical protein